MTIRTTKLIGKPKTDPAPTKSKASDSTSLEAICTEKCWSKSSTMALTNVNTTSVVKNARRRKKPINRPLTSPSSAPTPSVATTASSIGHLATLISPKTVRFASPKTDPTLRSMPPASMTIVMPITINPNSPICREVSARFPTERKFGMVPIR